MENIVNCIIETKAPEKIYKLKWTVENISNLPENRKLISPYFIFDGVNWNVRFTKSSCVDVELSRYPNCDELQIVCELKVLDCNKKVIYEKTLNTYKDGSFASVILTYPNITLNELKKAPNDTWYFIFIIKTCLITTKKRYEKKSHEMFTLCSDVWKIFENKIMTDVTLQVQDSKIEAHKLILSARSPVFAKMFETPMSESEKNTVVIDDVSKDAMTLLINFMYSKDAMECSFETAMELYYAADKYEMFELRELCGNILLSQITSENAGMLLELAVKHKDDSLKLDTMEFIKCNTKSCIKNDWWYELAGKKTELAKELMDYVV